MNHTAPTISADNVKEWLKQHNAGKVRYTKGRMPWNIHYVEEFKSRSQARNREAFFKSIDGYLYLKEKGII